MTARNHHYVPQWYLRRWQNEDRKVLFSRNGRVLSPTNPRNILAQRDFYAAPSLTTGDVAFLAAYVSQYITSENARPMAKVILEGAVFQSRLKELLSSPKLSETEREELSSYLTEFEEQRLAESESEAQAVIERLLDGDVTVLDEPEPALDFFQFLGEMIFRTRKARAQMQRVRDLGTPLSEGGGIVMARLTAATLACVQYFDRAAMPAAVLINTTKRGFITSDSPAVNILAPKEERVPEEREWAVYFPLSPSRALVIPPWNYRFVGRAVTDELVVDLNAWMAESAHEVLIARQRRDLLTALQENGRRPKMQGFFREAEDPLPLRK